LTRRLLAALLTFTSLGGSALAQSPAPEATTPLTSTPAPDAPSAPAPDAAKPDSAVAAPTAPAGTVAVPGVEHLNAGFGNEAFFLRSDDDNFVFIPSGRLQIDGYGYQGAGHDRQPFNTFSAKRARIEVFGSIMKHWDFQIGSEFTTSGNNQTFSTSSPSAVAQSPSSTDIYLASNYTPYANLQIGQFDAPFTMENRTSDKWTDMQERSRVVASFAIPEGKELGAMIFGGPEKKWAYYSFGAFNGEGQNNFKHTSNHFDAMGRAWIAPAGLAGNELLKNVWVGGSYYNGFRGESPANPSFESPKAYAATFGNQFDRLAMRDTAGLTFFSPAAGTVHAGDYGQRTGYAFELNAPIGPLVIKAEYVHLDQGLRELDYAAKAPAYVRTSKISGSGYYARASYFFWGDSLINGLAGSQMPPHLFGPLKPGKTATALQLVLNWDHLGFDYLADNDPDGKDPLAGRYNVDIYGIGLNYWHTKHIRITGNALYNKYTGSAYEKDDGTFKNTSLSPFGNSSYELTMRFALAI
jgi:phosphate-selective porin